VSCNAPMTSCPHCHKATSGLFLFPTSFREIDEAKKAANSLQKKGGRARKRKSDASQGVDDNNTYVSERRTGRWTVEEMTYCDKLIEKFESGNLPIADGIKLNEFLGNMLKSKQSRLTKKMKYAKLSTKTFRRIAGYLQDVDEAREFSSLEESFFNSIQDLQERAEIKFHMQREWREQFNQVCVSIGQPLDADAWLSSVEEMDRRALEAKNAARMTKRKLMMGFALRTDSRNTDRGIYIEKTVDEQIAAEHASASNYDEQKDADTITNFLAELKSDNLAMDMNGKSSLLHSAPFLAKVIAYLERHNMPFEHVDLWVPSFVPTTDQEMSGETCRLCFAGSATGKNQVDADGKTVRKLSADDEFSLFAFGDYSQKFSFDVGCGLPGRVYESGRPTWEQNVHNAPQNHFERCGGALQWGIKTVLGIPIASPNVGRIVVTLYSCIDRTKDQELVVRLMDEFTRVSSLAVLFLPSLDIPHNLPYWCFFFCLKLLPSPKWKLVVDIGEPEEPPSLSAAAATTVADTNTNATSFDVDVDAFSAAPVSTGGKDPRIDDVVSLLGEYMPSDPGCAMAPYLSGFMSLRLLLLRPSRSADEEELASTMLNSYSSYFAGGRSRNDIAIMLARDFMFLSQQQAATSQQQESSKTHQSSFLGLGQSQTSSAPAPSSVSVFGLPLMSSYDPAALATTPMPKSADSISIVSN